MNYKKTLIALLAMMAVWQQAYAAEVKPAAKNTEPITIEASKLYFEDTTGNILASGDVRITKGPDKLLAETVKGNSKTNDVTVEGQGTFIQPGLSIIGTDTRYNYKTQIGDMRQAKGTVDKERVAGETISITPGMLTVENGMVTTCPAIIPDYHLSADKIVVWPGDKLIAYNAKLWIKDKVIFSMPKLERSLKDDGQVIIPRIGYNSSDGISIAQYLEYPIAQNVSAYGDLAYYSQKGFRPLYGLALKNTAYTLKLAQGYEKNDDSEWIERRHELAFQSSPYRIGSSSVRASLFAGTGYWIGDSLTGTRVAGTRQDYKIYFANDPIKLSNGITMKVGTGFEQVHYGYNDSQNDIWMANILFTGKVNERLELLAGYNYHHQSGESVYQYDTIDVPRELLAGFMYKLDRLNGVGIQVSYNLDTEKAQDVDYTWRHNLHCFDADLTYREKRDSWILKVSPVKW